MINKHKSNKIKENSNTVRHLNNGIDHRHSKSCCDQSSPARRTIKCSIPSQRASNTEFWCAHVISLNKLLNKQSNSWWFETPWRTCNVNVTLRNYFGFAMKIYSLYLFTMCTESVYTEKTWTTRICMFDIPASISGYAIFCKFLTPLLTMVLSPKVLFKLLLKLKLLFSMCKYI